MGLKPCKCEPVPHSFVDNITTYEMQEAITTSTVTRKHSVKKYLNELTRGQARDARDELPRLLGLTYHYFNRLTNITVDNDRFGLSVEQAEVLARYFKVSVEEILAPYEEEVGKR